jgi:hypothetical protein
MTCGKIRIRITFVSGMWTLCGLWKKGIRKRIPIILVGRNYGKIVC